MGSVRQLLTFALSTFVCSYAVAQEVSLPGNASSLSETHASWTVQCVIASATDGSKAKQCALSQQQIEQKTGQRALAIELTADNGIAKGNLVLPFGLDLQKGVSLQIDDGATGATLQFRTCLPAGCLVDVMFDAKMITSLKSGTTLKVRATPLGAREITFSIALSGFASSYERVVELLKT
ncbi:invasion protein IalB [Rhizobium sp. BK529]|uniref:invasion associated locus B family protein n=1 Tax=unclassified Rhizobium TaxID=2613769 RepID=UPI00104FB3F4|nr:MULTISPECIES: invasion associated locus B family protein [unclassified Rhizobium]MBB3594214.1 invasion protein IalB [Rhizobium sp. BK529]TCS01670.1 invasion protein IalB [Rhizobium sp. BK418]